MSIVVKRRSCYRMSTDDKPGVLAKISALLKNANVNLRGIWAFGIGQGKAVIVADPEDKAQFTAAVQKAGYSAKESAGFCISGQDQIGALCEALDKISQAGLNLHAVDAISVGGQFAGYLWADEKNVDAIAKALGV